MIKSFIIFLEKKKKNESLRRGDKMLGWKRRNKKKMRWWKISLPHSDLIFLFFFLLLIISLLRINIFYRLIKCRRGCSLRWSRLQCEILAILSTHVSEFIYGVKALLYELSYLVLTYSRTPMHGHICTYGYIIHIDFFVFI